MVGSRGGVDVERGGAAAFQLTSYSKDGRRSEVAGGDERQRCDPPKDREAKLSESLPLRVLERKRLATLILPKLPLPC